MVKMGELTGRVVDADLGQFKLWWPGSEQIIIYDLCVSTRIPHLFHHKETHSNGPAEYVWKYIIQFVVYYLYTVSRSGTDVFTLGIVCDPRSTWSHIILPLS